MSSVTVHGLGYIGLPTATILAASGHTVFGYDADETVRERLRNGRVDADEPGLAQSLERVIDDTLEITDEPVPAGHHLICVPTPFDTETKQADLGAVQSASSAIASVLRPGDAVILESTVPPGTTSLRIGPLLEQSGMVLGDEILLSHCPETVLPGAILSELRTNNRIVGGWNAKSAEAAARLYDSFVTGTIRTTTDPTIAEFAKLIQNTYRDTNIALANEIARLASDYSIDSRETIALANEHPRVDILAPGPGVGGHCLPIDPWFLGERSDELDLIATARRVNDGMIDFVIDILRQELGKLGGHSIAILGAAYKGNVSDTRMSPGIRLSQQLQHKQEVLAKATDGGVVSIPDVRLHDPHVSDQTLTLSDLETATTAADAIVLTTDHDEFTQLDPDEIGDRMTTKLLIDTKAVLDADRWKAAGFRVRRI